MCFYSNFSSFLFRAVGSGLTDLKKEVTSMKSTSEAQLEAMEAAVTNLHQNTYDMSTQLTNLEAEHANLRASILEQMTSINEAVEAQTGVIKMHDSQIKDANFEAKRMEEETKNSFQNLGGKVTEVTEDLEAKSLLWKGQFEHLSSVVMNHDSTVNCMNGKLDQLSMEFRGVLQTVDDQVIFPFFLITF